MSPLRILMCAVAIIGMWMLETRSPAEAHPFHTTTAEMEYNPKSGRFELAVKVPVADLEEALTRQAALRVKDKAGLGGLQAAQTTGSSQRVALAETPEIERLIVAYLKTHFFLTLLSTDGTGEAGADTQSPGDVAEQGPEASSGARPGDSGEARSRLHWLGMELDKASAWLYFELEPPAGDKLSLANELFIELNAQQINTCTLLAPATKFSLRTDARHRRAALPPQARWR